MTKVDVPRVGWPPRLTPGGDVVVAHILVRTMLEREVDPGAQSDRAGRHRRARIACRKQSCDRESATGGVSGDCNFTCVVLVQDPAVG